MAQTKEVNGLYFHGSSMNDFLKPSKFKNKIECWVKILSLVYFFKVDPKNDGKDFFVSNRTLHNRLNKLGNHYKFRTIQKAVKTIEIEKLGTITYSWAINPNNNKKYLKRVIDLNMRKVDRYLSVIDLDMPAFRELKARARLKKLVLKRPFDLASKSKEAFEYCVNSLNKGFKNVKDCLTFFVDNYSRKYMRVDPYFKNFKRISDQEFVDSNFLSNIKVDSSTGEAKYIVNSDDVSYVEQLYSSKAKGHLNKLNEALKKLVGAYVYDDTLVRRLNLLKLNITSSGYIDSGPNNNELNHGGFTELY